MAIIYSIIYKTITLLLSSALSFVVVLSLLVQCSQALTTGCIDRNTPSSACCSGDIEISNSITSIANNAFDGCSITSVIIPNSVTTIGYWAFYNNQIASLTIPNSVTTIGDYAFQGNKIASLTIPNNVTLKLSPCPMVRPINTVAVH